MPMVSLKLMAGAARSMVVASARAMEWVRGYDAMMSPVMSSKRSGGIAMRSTASQTPVIATSYVIADSGD